MTHTPSSWRTRFGLLIPAFTLVGLSVLLLNQCGAERVLFQTLHRVKDLRGAAVDWQALEGTGPPPDHSLWDTLLKRHVDTAGWVDYPGFRTDSAGLRKYLQRLSQQPPAPDWTPAQKLAYWINAYNAFTVQLILEHWPVTSIRDIAGGIPMINSPWDLQFFELDGIPFDLNTIEHDLLRGQFDEPRVHFALNCASVSCPRLRRQAYTAPSLEAQLTDQARSFLANPEKNQITPTEIRISRLFDWFRDDFTQTGPLQDYLNQYTPVHIRADARIAFLEYNWQLNSPPAP